MGFRPYVDALAFFLTRAETVPPLTVSLEGEWGSGKSSFIEQLREAIKLQPVAVPSEPSKPFYFDFNAWQHDKDEALWASFALAFVRKAMPGGLFARARVQAALDYKRRNKAIFIMWVIAVLVLALILVVVFVPRAFYPQLQSDGRQSDFSWWVTYLPKVFTAVVGIPIMAKLVAGLVALFKFPMSNLEKFVEKPDYKEKLGFLERFHEDFERCVATYIPDRRAFVFIDDLDRCEVPKAVELLHALNLMLAKGLPFVVVLAMDRPKIAAGVATRHKELLRFLPGPSIMESSDALNERARGLAHGYEFVEKFVQLSIRIPRLGPKTLPLFLRSLVSPSDRLTSSEVAQTAALEDPVATDGEEVQRVLELVAPVLGFNPRRIKQFLNLFRFRYFVARKTEPTSQNDEWTLPQLGKLVALELHWPALLDALLAQPGAVTQLCELATGMPLQEGPLKAVLREESVLLAFLNARADGRTDETFAWVAPLLGRLYGAAGIP